MDYQLFASVSLHEIAIVLFALLLALVFALVIRQNQKDYLDIVAWVNEEKPGG